MAQIVYRVIKKADYKSIENIIITSFHLDSYVEDEGTLRAWASLYLQSCLCEQTYNCVAECNGKIVGVIMGQAAKYYSLLHHIPYLFSVLWFNLCMKFHAAKSKTNIEDFEKMQQIYHKLLSESTNTYDGVLTLFAVDELYRGYGIGTNLLKYLQNYLKNHQVKRVYLYTDSSCNVAFYDRHDFSCVGSYVLNVSKEKQITELNVYLYEKSI